MTATATLNLEPGTLNSNSPSPPPPVSPSPALPPSARDFLIFERLVVENATTRTVAAELGLSQTRVRQIALRVTHWLAETLPTAEADLSEAVQLRLAQHIAADRLERLFVLTNRAFEETDQAKFANLCIRILDAQSKLPVITGTLQALAADAIEGPLPDDTSSLFTTSTTTTAPLSAPQSTISNTQSPISTTPPIRACSPPRQSPSVAPDKPTAIPLATPTAPTPSDHNPTSARTARAAFLAPAHSSENYDQASILQLKITPENLGFTTTNKNPSRKQRRRLQRLATVKKWFFGRICG